MVNTTLGLLATESTTKLPVTLEPESTVLKVTPMTFRKNGNQMQLFRLLVAEDQVRMRLLRRPYLAQRRIYHKRLFTRLKNGFNRKVETSHVRSWDVPLA